jgi:energy-coupling factor transporter ATP-binding protein EcfA2
MSNFISYIPLFIGLMLMLAGAPAFMKIYELTQNLTVSIAITIIYELVILIGGFVTKVWKQLEGKWSERLADRIDLAFQSIFSGYRKRYLEYLVYQHRSFDIKGLSTQGPYNLDLEGVYVQLNIDPSTLHAVSANIIQTLPNELRSGSHSIWEYLSGKNIAGNNYAIVGAPGSGKTTLLKHTALTLAAPKHRRQRVNAPDLLPIFLFLRDHAQDIKENTSVPLAQLIRDQFKKRQAPAPPTGWLETQLERGKCLIMLDGLDEVADPLTRKKVVAWVEQCMGAYGKNRFILSSRPYGYKSNPLGNVTVLQVRPFTTSQVEQFIRNWYLANEIMRAQRDDPGVREEARQGSSNLIERVRSTPALSDLAVNPLLLTMITTVHKYRNSLPGRRVELYAEICDVFLGKRQQAKDIVIDLTPPQITRVLRQLAYSMMEKQLRVIESQAAQRVISHPLASVSPKTKSNEFLEDVENNSGLLVEFETGSYSFSHLTFQEYLASIHVIENRRENDLLNQVKNPWWHETIRLYCAQTDASNVISACLNSSDVTALSLAIECMDEAREVRPEIRKQFEEVMEKGVEDPDPERRKLIATAWLKRRTG